MNRRVRFFQRILVLLVMALLLVLPAGEALARKWVFADARAWNVLRACRDGIVVSAIFDSDSDLEGSPFEPINLAVYHYTNTVFDPPDNEGRLPEETPSIYGPQILPFSPVVMSVQDVPLVVTTGIGGSKSYPIHTFASLRWTISLTPGEDTVVVIQDQNNQNGDYFGSAEPIQDCTIAQFRFSVDANLTLGPDHLSPSSPGVPSDQLVYRLDWTPSKGNLFMDDGLLDQSGTFSQADVEAGRLAYRSDGESQSDFFAVRPFYASWVSKPLSGEDPDGGSSRPTISENGRYIAFSNSSSNMDPNYPGNGYEQVYLRDRDSDENGIYDEPDGESLSLISIGIDGNPADENAYDAHLSADGRFVAFSSSATNLVPGDVEGYTDIFVAGEGKIVRVSVASDGTPADNVSSSPVLSEDGRYVAFASYANNLDDDAFYVRNIFVHDRDVDEDGDFDEAGSIKTEAITSGTDNNSYSPSISPDGRFVAFYSEATNLHPRDNELVTDVYLYDRENGKLELVSGYDESGTEWLSDGDSVSNSNQAISADGRYVVFESSANFDDSDGNGYADVYLYDNLTHRNRLISHDYRGVSGTGESYGPSISANGRFIAFRSLAYDLVDNDTEASEDVFVYDQFNREMLRVSENITEQADPPDGVQNRDHPMLSGDGSFVVFYTLSANLVANSRTWCAYNGEAFPCPNIVAAHVGFPMLFPLEIQEALFLPLLR